MTRDIRNTQETDSRDRNNLERAIWVNPSKHLYQHYQHTETNMFTPDLPEVFAQNARKLRSQALPVTQQMAQNVQQNKQNKNSDHNGNF